MFGDDEVDYAGEFIRAFPAPFSPSESSEVAVRLFDAPLQTRRRIFLFAYALYVFGMAGMLWLEFLRAHRRDNAPLWHAWAGAFVCPVLFSGMVELLQEYCTTYRGGDWLDFAANTTGAVLASMVGYFILRPRMK